MPEIEDRRLVRHRIYRQINAGKAPHRLAVIKRFLHRLVGQRVPLLQKVNPQHPLQRHRWPTAFAFRIKRGKTRHQPRPRHDLLHLGQKLVSPRLLPLARIFRLRKAALLLHRPVPQLPTANVIPPRRQVPLTSGSPKLTPALAEDLRRRRRGKVGRSWYVDETYLKVQGRWCYLYRAIDRNGNLVDVLFSEHRDMAAAQAFFRSAKAVTGVTPDRVTTDGHDSYPRAIRTELGQDVRHRTSAYLNNRLEQDHRGIKGRYRPMRGFKCPRSAARFCRAYDELRNFLRSRSRR